MKKKVLSVLLVFAVMVIALGAYAPAANAADPELVTVRFGNLPYLDYTPWVLAEKKGFLEEEGIKLEMSLFEVEQPLAEALISGSVDVGGGSDTPFILLSAKAPELRMAGVTVVFIGYGIMARPGEVETYDEVLQRVGDPAKALEETCKQLKGKEIILPGGASFTPVLDTALAYAGLTRDDVKIIDMEAVEGAAAFIRGTADFYIDGLPQRLRLEKEGFVALATGEQLAGGAMVLAGLYTTDKYLTEHPDVIIGLMRAWYKAVGYLHENPDEALQIMTDWLNEVSGAGMTVEEGKRFIEDLVVFPTYEESIDFFYGPKAHYQWVKRLQFVIDFFTQTGELDPTKLDDLYTLVPAPAIYLLANPAE